MPRKIGNWLQGYQEFAQGTESPPMFHWWVALSTLAGAAQRKIYLDLDYFQIYTNMFIILVSPPGRSRKGTALRIGKSFLSGAKDYGQEIHFSTQASSVAALIKQLATINNQEHQSLTAVVFELGSLLGSRSVEMTDFLTDIYDCNPDWDKQTVGRGLEKIAFPWFNLLGATTPQWMGENLSRTAVEGGFVSRTLFIYEEDRIRVALPKLTDEQRKIKRHLIHDLAEIAALKGEFILTPEAKEFYTDWYENKLDNEAQLDYRLGGYYERKHIHVLKVAMLLRLAMNNITSPENLIIEPVDIEAAIGCVSEIEPGMRKAFSAVGKNIYSTDLDRILAQVRSGKEVKYKEILAANIHAVDKETIDKLLVSLIQMGDIKYNEAKEVYSAEIHLVQ